MAELAKFISGDGTQHEVVVGSPAFDHMVKESFMRVNEFPAEGEAAVALLATEITESSETGSNDDGNETTGNTAGDESPVVPAVDLSKLSRPALIDEALKVGVVIDAADKSQTKAVIIAAIEEQKKG